MSLRGHIISSIYSSSKLETKLKVISRYLEVIPVSFREIAETSRKVTNLRAQSCPEKSSFETIPESRKSFTWRSAQVNTD